MAKLPFLKTSQESQSKRSNAELYFEMLLKTRGVDLPDHVIEHKFHPSRRWRYDFAWPDSKVAVEIEGGVYISGRHNQGAGYESDIEKYNESVILGWKVIRFTPGQLRADPDRCIEYIRKLVF